MFVIINDKVLAACFLLFLVGVCQNGNAGVRAQDWILTESTALMRAAADGNLNEVRILVESGTDISEQNKYHATALVFAASEGRAKVVQYLLGKGADPNLCASYNMCPLWFAVNSGSSKTVELLLKSGANAKEVPEGNSLENSPLIVAVIRGEQEIVKMLVKYRVEIDLENWRTGGTALTAAVAVGESALVTFLLNNGADPTKTMIQLPYYGNTSPLDHANELGYSDVVRIIKDRLKQKKYQNRILTVDNIVVRLYEDKSFILEEVHDVVKYVTNSDLRLIKNAIFARNSYRFDSEDLLSYYKERFRSYKPKTKKVKLSDIDRKNLDYVKRMKGYITDRDAAG